MLVDFFPTENILFRDFLFSLPRESSFLQRIPGSAVVNTHRADNVGDVADGGPRSSPQVQHLGAGLDVNVLHPSNNGCSQLGSEGVPRSVLHFDLPFLQGVVIIIILAFKDTIRFFFFF